MSDSPGVRSWTMLTVPQVAERLQVGERAVRSLIDRGLLRAAHVGRFVRVREEWVEDFLDSEVARVG